MWSAVAFISIATACHQAWSANMFTVASDAFPSRVVGFGGMCGGIGGMLMLLVAGGLLQWLGSFTPLFIFAGVMHPLAWIAIRALVGKNIAQIDLHKGLRTAQSPALLAMGLGLMALGAGWPPPTPTTCSTPSTPPGTLLGQEGVGLIAGRRRLLPLERAAGHQHEDVEGGGQALARLGLVAAVLPLRIAADRVEHHPAQHAVAAGDLGRHAGQGHQKVRRAGILTESLPSKCSEPPALRDTC